jgi:hypothetical protein
MSKSPQRRFARNVAEHLEPRRLLSDVIAVGQEFQVNTYTTGSQLHPALATDADGDFLIAWHSNGQDGSSYGVYAQRYDAAGIPQGTEFRVNSYTTGIQARPSVGIDAIGNFVIAWYSAAQDGSFNGIYAQRYDSAGLPQGDEFRVNTYTTNSQTEPAVAMDADGDFVIAWYGSGAGDDYGVFAQRYNAAAVPQGGEFCVNTYTTSGQLHARVATDANGDFVIAWESTGQDGGGGNLLRGVYAQRYNSDGVRQGSEFRVNNVTINDQKDASIAMDANGNFVVAWADGEPGQDGSGLGVYARRFDAAGVAQGLDFRVNTYTTGHQHLPSIGMDANGNFVVSWFGAGHAGSGTYAQRYTAAGAAQGGEFRVDTTGGGFTNRTAMDTDGDFVVAWVGFEVRAQRFGVVPEVTVSSFHFATAPHKLRFTFDRDVSASLGTDDLVVQNLTTMQTIPSSHFSLAYDTATNVATFTYAGATAGIAGMLPDGRYAATLVAAGVTTVQGAPLAADIVLNFRFLQGDASNDGRVNLDDFNVLAANFGQSPRDFTQGDFDYSGNVNLNDFNILAARFGQVLAGPGTGAKASDGLRRRDAWLDELLA